MSGEIPDSGAPAPGSTAPGGPAPDPARRRRRARKVVPVAAGADLDAVFHPEAVARPVAAALLLAGPLLSAAGVAGWLRLLSGVPRPYPVEASWMGLAWDLALLLLFAVPHSLLARGFGRRLLNKPLGPAGERPLYVLQSGVTLALLAATWRTSGPLLYELDGLLLVLARLLQILGLGLAAWATVVFGLGGILGLPHLRALRTGRQPPAPELLALPPYRHARHPANLGTLLMLLAMPEVTLDRALMAAVLVPWILVSAAWEERDAELTFGHAYRAYKARTPRWIPRLRWTEEP